VQINVPLAICDIMWLCNNSAEFQVQL